MKKIILLCLMLFMIVGCQTKEEKKETPPSNEEVFGEEYKNGSAMGITNYSIQDNLIELEIMYEKRPIDREHVSFVVQDNDMVPFSFQKDGQFEYSQRFKMDGEKLKNNKIYVKPSQIKKGQAYNFYVVFIDVPEYMPKASENVHYEDQDISTANKAITFDQNISNKEVTIRKAKTSKWNTIKNGNGNLAQGGFLEYENKETLKGLCEGTINQMNVPVIKWEVNQTLKWNVAVKKEYVNNGGMYFFLDHQPLMIKNDFDYLKVDYQGNDFGLSEIELLLPRDIKKGYHTFYSLTFAGGEANSPMLEQRMVLVE